MTVARRTVQLLVVSVAATLCLLPAAAGAAGATARPELGPLSPGFVEALHDPLVTLGLGRVPSPVEVTVGNEAEARAARAALPSGYDLRREGRLTAVKDQGDYSTCWAFGSISALESKLMPTDPPPDYSEDNVIGRSGYGPVFPGGYDAYSFGGYDSMAIAYFARWAGPVNEADDPYATAATYGDPHVSGPVQKHVQGVTMIPGRSSALDNELVKQLVTKNGALSVGMYMDPSRCSTGPPTRTTTPSGKARTTASTSSGGTTRTPPATSGREPCSRPATAPSWCATAGATPSATAATSGSPTTTAPSPPSRASAASAA